jgi:hypothetical protein
MVCCFDRKAEEYDVKSTYDAFLVCLPPTNKTWHFGIDLGNSKYGDGCSVVNLQAVSRQMRN